MNHHFSNFHLRKMVLAISLLGLGQFTPPLWAQQVNAGVVATGAELEKVSSSFKFTEGPAVNANGHVYFTDQPNNQILVWKQGQEIDRFLAPAGRSNGMYFDHDGYLVTCADEKNEIWRINSQGQHEVLLKDLEGQTMNGPNDLWIDDQGGIFFTDPFYKRPWWNHESQPIASENVYYLPAGSDQATVVIDDLVKPNGLVGSKNGKKLYVADIGANKTYEFRIKKKGRLTGKKIFAELGSDGMTLDHLGNVYLTGKGVSVFNKNGEKIHQIDVPENWTANVVFGGPEQKTLFITAMGSVYTLAMNVHGIR